MKKLKLTVLNLGATEVLSRSQLKNILGGLDGSGDGSGGFSKCSVKCGSVVKEKDCGYGNICVVSNTSISCDNGKNYTEMCS